MSSLQQVRKIEQAMSDDIRKSIPELRSETRFIPYIQLHEYKGLLFSDLEALARALKRPALVPALQSIRIACPTPEDINDGRDTAPSKRILAMHPSYKKVVEGTLAAAEVGIPTMRKECPHFRGWIEHLEGLPSLPG